MKVSITYRSTLGWMPQDERTIIIDGDAPLIYAEVTGTVAGITGGGTSVVTGLTYES